MEYTLISEQCSKGIEIFKEATKLVDDGRKDSFYQSLANQLIDIQKQFAEQKLTILIAGEVKTGKSTFINTLLGIDILATAPEVCTNVPTKIVYGKNEKIVVHFAPTKEGIVQEPLEILRSEMANYSTERINKENKENVDYIEIQIESPLLAEGLAFIDTPGLGAIDPLHAIATYRIATKTDIIFFLGDAKKPLTDSEISSLKNLIKVSRSEQIVHLLTCCDLKNPDEILQSNKKMFEKDFPNSNIMTINISSLLYHRYVKSGNRALLDGSGFQQVKTYIADINAELKTLLNRRFAHLVYAVCHVGHKSLAELIEIVENPEAMEKKAAELKALLDRLQAIEDNRLIWNQKLMVKQQCFNEELGSYINDEQHTIIDNVSENLKDDRYLNDKEALTNSITAELIDVQCNLREKMSDGFIEIYEWLRRETGLKKIQEQIIQLPEKVPANMTLDSEIGNIKLGEKISDAYGAFSRGIAITGVVSSLGGWTGSAVGAKIGAAIGSAIAPVIGTVIGAALGALTGIFSGFAVFNGSKEVRKRRQRNEILAALKLKINDFFNNVRGEIKKANIPNSTDLNTRFLIELREEKNNLDEQHRKIKNEALRIRDNYEAIKELANKSMEICNTLNSYEA